MLVLFTRRCQYNGMYAAVMQLRGLINQVKATMFYIRKCMYQVRNMTVTFYLFEVFELLILTFDYELSVLNFPREFDFFVIFSFFFCSVYLKYMLSFTISAENNSLIISCLRSAFLDLSSSGTRKAKHLKSEDV